MERPTNVLSNNFRDLVAWKEVFDPKKSDQQLINKWLQNCNEFNVRLQGHRKKQKLAGGIIDHSLKDHSIQSFPKN